MPRIPKKKKSVGVFVLLIPRNRKKKKKSGRPGPPHRSRNNGPRRIGCAGAAAQPGSWPSLPTARRRAGGGWRRNEAAQAIFFFFFTGGLADKEPALGTCRFWPRSRSSQNRLPPFLPPRVAAGRKCARAKVEEKHGARPAASLDGSSSGRTSGLPLWVAKSGRSSGLQPPRNRGCPDSRPARNTQPAFGTEARRARGAASKNVSSTNVFAI